MIDLMFILIVLVPFLVVFAAWQFLDWIPTGRRGVIAVLVSVAPMASFGWIIYSSEGGGDDPDPLLFLMISVGLATSVALLIIAALIYSERKQ